jgi:endoglucanase
MRQIRAKVPLRIVAVATLLLSIGVLSTQKLASADAPADCAYDVTSDWGGGFVASITISNSGSTALDGWEIDFELAAGSTVTHAWGATIDGTNPYTATAIGWNSELAPGQSAVLGFVGEGEDSIGTITRCEASETGDPGTTTTTQPTTTTTDATTTTVPSPTTVPTTIPDGLGDLTAVQLSQQMGVGWNLGNSLESWDNGAGDENAWGNPDVTPEIIQAVKAAGFDTIRIPVAWSSFSDESTYTIDPAWLARVEEVVNYALAADMYVVMNEHWDGGWLNNPVYSQQDALNQRLGTMWTQIATHFRDYDRRLIFAGTNEVMMDGDYGTPTQEYVDVQNSFNQTFVDTVRATGGNNADRFLIVQGFNTNIDHTVDFAQIPQDTVSDKLFMEIHYYDPYNFTLNTDSQITEWPSDEETWANEDWVDQQMAKMKTNFIDRGVAVLLGEYGVVSRTDVAGHEESRIRWNSYVTGAAADNGIVPVYWDNGYLGDGGLGLFDRNDGRQVYPDLITAIVDAD